MSPFLCNDWGRYEDALWKESQPLPKVQKYLEHMGILFIVYIYFQSVLFYNEAKAKE